jgi:chorismate synthase
MPWSARQTYRRTRAGAMEEAICAENNIAFDASVSEIPKADKPDF